MAVQEKVTRKQAGLSPDGTPVVEVTWHGQARRPESVGEWAEQRVAALGPSARLPAGRVVVALLGASGEAEVTAAVGAGRDLDVTQRWAVLVTLRAWLDAARDTYPPAASVADRLCRAWVAKWGSEQPQRVA